MRTSRGAAGDVDTYIAGFPHDVQKILRKVRQTIRKAAPDAQETISYQIPTFTQNGVLIHFRLKNNLEKAEAGKKKR